MRIAFFSPMPPSRSGIADYSSALVDRLSKRAEITVFDRESERFNVNDFDIPVYQIGNNGYHSFVYEEALRTPGVVVLHESNLHHLLAEITIKRNDWDGYLREVEYDGGAKALAYASRVRGLEAGPDYEGVPMLRRILEASKGVIVHSRYVERDVRQAGYEGSAAVIPHGAWMPEVDRMGRRHQLGVDALTPLIGIFGFLKPYKRIAESLRAFKRVLRVEPRAKMILVGEPHPDFPLQSIVSELGLGNNVRITGFTPIEDFVEYIAACDIVLNLRWPTVGESSGTLLRSLGLGRAVIVSDVGSFAEYPDEICLKVPVGPREEDTLFEYLNLLVSRPQFAEAMGVRAREWVKRECNWDSVADKYIDYLDAVAQGREFVQAAAAGNSGNSVAVTEPGDEQRDTEPEYIVSWAEDADAGKYIRTHMTRLMKTLELIPRGDADQRILEMGVYHQITPALKTKLGYGEVRGCYYGTAGQVVYKEIESSDGELFGCYVDLFDAERDRFPYADEHFNTVVCGELIEHLPSDPMHMMSEVNRILKPGGHLVLTTPNISSLRAISAILQGYHPGFFPAYIRPKPDDADHDARHAREYTPPEIERLFRDSGFEVTRLETGEFRDEPHPEHRWVLHLLETYRMSTALRGDGLYAVGVKRGPIRERYPTWLFD